MRQGHRLSLPDSASPLRDRERDKYATFGDRDKRASGRPVGSPVGSPGSRRSLVPWDQLDLTERSKTTPSFSGDVERSGMKAVRLSDAAITDSQGRSGSPRGSPRQAFGAAVTGIRAAGRLRREASPRASPTGSPRAKSARRLKGTSPSATPHSDALMATYGGTQASAFSLGGTLGRTCGSLPASPMGLPAGSPQRRKSRAGDDGGEGRTNVQVCLRVRPFIRREVELHEASSDQIMRSVIEMPRGMDAGKVDFLQKIQGEDDEYKICEQFTFDKAFCSLPEEMQRHEPEYASQTTIYEKVGLPALANAWSGFNTCIFAYGQTGSGKTHTMMGNYHLSADAPDIDGDPGVIPQLCRALYQSIEEKQGEQEADNPMRRIRETYETELCAYQIYNERVRDLFFEHTPGRDAMDELKVRQHPVDGPFVDRISLLRPTTWQQCIKLIEEGTSWRATAATEMNDQSSRSHCVFQIKFTQVRTSIPREKFEKPVTHRKFSCVNLIDLAGSERNKKSKAEGARLVEASKINLSLSTLKRVIDALVEGRPAPYRESQLTMLLSHSLGGNSKTMMIACVSPHHDNAEETLNTLRYASQARKIVNLVRRNEDTQAKMNMRLQEELEYLQERLQAQEAGDADPDELEDLQEQIAMAEDELEHKEQELRTAEEAAEKLRHANTEEREKRYQAAYEHSFQMVVLRKQKEMADQKAQQVEGLREQLEDADKIRVDLDMTQRELVAVRDQKTARDVEARSAEQKLRLIEESLQEHRLQRKQSIERRQIVAREMEQERAQERRSLTQQHSSEKSELVEERRRLDRRVAELERALDAEQRASQRRAEQLERQHQAELEREREAGVAAQRDMSSLISQRGIAGAKAQFELEQLRRKHDDTARSHARREERLLADAQGRVAEVERTANERARVEWEGRLLRVEERAERRILDMRDEHAEELGRHAVRVKEAADGEVATERRLRAELQDRCDEQCRVLRDVVRREREYRGLAQRLFAAIDAVDAGADVSADLRDFLRTAQDFRAALVSHPINRAAVSRVAVHGSKGANPRSRSTDPPCVALEDEAPPGSITPRSTVVGTPGRAGRMESAGQPMPILSPRGTPLRNAYSGASHVSWSPGAHRREAAQTMGSSARRQRSRSPPAVAQNGHWATPTRSSPRAGRQSPRQGSRGGTGWARAAVQRHGAPPAARRVPSSQLRQVRPQKGEGRKVSI